jgi:hypothetical protein
MLAENRSNLAGLSVVPDNHIEAMRVFFITLTITLVTASGVAQDATSSAADLARLRADLDQTRSQLSDSLRQMDELRQRVDELQQKLADKTSDSAAQTPEGAATSEPTAAEADQDAAFLAAKVNELHQDKVESGSKYPVKLSGLILFNAFSNSGNVDLADVPNLAFPTSPGIPGGSIGATLRQTVIRVDATGPKLLGADSSANLSIDFAGGNPTTTYGLTAGLLRLRTATAHLDWKTSSLWFGQDGPFFSPLSPTSYATLLEPALSWSGNLWVWTPQVAGEKRFQAADSTQIVLQGGLLDPLTEEIPDFEGREPTAGEQTRVPAVAGRIAVDHSSSEAHPFTIGFSGYHAQQKYGTLPQVQSWTVNTDFKIRISKLFELSGEGYRGQAAGGLGGGIWSSVVFPEPTSPHTAIWPLSSAGGWAQLKFTPAPRFEINTAFGQDENFAEDIRWFASPNTVGGFPPLQKNQTEFVNFIFKPNSVLLFATEYRHIFTLPSVGESATASQVNVSAGARF